MNNVTFKYVTFCSHHLGVSFRFYILSIISTIRIQYQYYTSHIFLYGKNQYNTTFRFCIQIVITPFTLLHVTYVHHIVTNTLSGDLVWNCRYC
jgi:citrate lyase synthetase